MNRIDALREGGFSETEIADWVQKRRDALKGGGFSDADIDSYLTGGPAVPEGIPPAVERRLQDGEIAQQRMNGLIQNVPLFAEMISSPEGRTKIWEAVKKYPAAMVEGLIDLAKVPGDVNSGKLDLSTQEGLDKAIGLGALIGLGRFSRVGKTGKTSGLSVAEGDVVGRIERRPDGTLVEEPLGAKPNSSDFVDIADTIVGAEAPKSAHQKLVSLWERGYHPAEVLRDAETDPTIKQHLLSKESDVPSRYLRSEDFTKQDDLFGAQPEQGTFRFMNEPESLPGNVPDKYNVGDRGTYRDQKGRIRSIRTEPVSREDMEWGLNVGRRGEQPIYKRMIDDNTTDRVQAELALEDNYQPRFRFDSGDLTKADLEGQPGVVVSKETEPKTASEPPKPPEKPSTPDTDTPEGWASWLSHKLYTDFVDNLHPISRVDKEAYKEGRLFRGRFGVVKQFLENGTVDFHTLKRRGKSLNDILATVKDHEGLNAYLKDQAEARALGPDAVAAVERLKAGQKKFGKVAKEIDKFRSEVTDYLYDSGVLSAETRDGLKLLDDNYTALAPVLNGETIPVDPLANIIRNTYHYIGLAQKNRVNQKLFQALEKAGIGVEHQPSLSAEFGKAMRTFAKANGEKAPPAAVTNVLKNMLPDDGANFSAIFDGQRRTLRIDDPELIRAIRNMSPQNLGVGWRFLSHPASWLRAGVTLDPAFMAKNIIRDSFTALVTAGSSPLNTLRGLGHAVSGTRLAKQAGIKPTETFQDWLSSGGANATLVHLDQRYMQQSLRHLENQTGLTRRVWNVVRSPLDGLRLTSELIENSVRLGAFEKALKGKTRTPEALRDAGFVSREVTLDFARIGAKTQGWNMISAFFNAGIQGPDRLARAFKDAPIATATKVGLGITVPSLLLWWANRGDPRYQNLPQWQKDMFWIFLTDDWQPISEADAQGKPEYLIRRGKNGLEFNNGTIWRVLKPFELGILFGTLAERAAEQFFNQNPEAFAHLSDTFSAAFNLNVVPTAVAPFIEQGMNTSQMTGRPIIPSYLEKEVPDYQYTPYTTELSKFVGHAIASLPGVRDKALDQNSQYVGGAARAATTPVLIENLVRSWTGGLGALVLQGLDAAGRKTALLTDTRGPTETLADNPFIKAFVIRNPSASTQDIEDFYNEYSRNERYLTSWRSRLEQGDVEAASKLAEAGGDEIFVKLDNYKKALGQMGAAIRGVYKNPDIPPDEQRQIIDELYFGMHEIGTLGKETLRMLRGNLQTETPTPNPKPSVNPGIKLQ